MDHRAGRNPHSDSLWGRRRRRYGIAGRGRWSIWHHHHSYDDSLGETLQFQLLQGWREDIKIALGGYDPGDYLTGFHPSLVQAHDVSVAERFEDIMRIRGLRKAWRADHCNEQKGKQRTRELHENDLLKQITTKRVE